MNGEPHLMSVMVPCLMKTVSGGQVRSIALGHPLLDDYLEFVAARARPNTLIAVAYDLKVFFTVIVKQPADITTADVLTFIKAQRAPRRGAGVVRLEDGEAGLSARTIKRRLASVSGLFGYLIARADAGVNANPVPRGLATRGRRGRAGVRGAPLIRAPRTLPRVLEPAEADAFVAALRTQRDRAMVAAMLLGGLRRCEVLGLRLPDLRPGERRVFVADGKGGRQRIVPISARFFSAVAAYYDTERPRTSSTETVFVVLKGPRRGQPLSAAGLDEIIEGARKRAGLTHLTCHQLRHTCFTRLREAGMALEAIQAQAGHASIESTRVYLHLANDWLAGEYLRAARRSMPSRCGRDRPAGVDRSGRGPHRRIHRRTGRGRGTRGRRGRRRAGLLRPLPHPATFSARPVEEQVRLPGHQRRFACWLMVTARMSVSAQFLARADLRLGVAAARYYPALRADFGDTARTLGSDHAWVLAQWSVLAQLAALHGVRPAQVTAEQLDVGGDALLAAFARPDHPTAGRRLRSSLVRLRATLFHAGMTDTPPRLRRPNAGRVAANEWAAVPPGLAQTAHRYLAQIELSLRPSTVRLAEHALRELAGYLARRHRR